MEEINAFVEYNVTFLKECINKGILTEEHKSLLVEYRDKLIDMASVLDVDGIGREGLTKLITLRFEEELVIQ